MTMSPQRRQDLIFVFGYVVFVLGLLLKKQIPGVYTGLVVDTHILLGISIFSIFWLLSLLAVARSPLLSKYKLGWIAALLCLAPLTLPLAYLRFLRQTAPRHA